MATIEDFWQEIDRRMDSKLESALDGLGASSSAPAGTPARSAGVLPVHNNLHHEPPLALESDLASHVVTIASGAALGHVKVGANLSIDGEGILSAASGVTTFEALTDTPASYAGAAGYLLRVNATPNAIEFVDGATLYAATGHNHDASYAAIGHNHDAAYSAIGHDHAGVYDPSGTAAAAVSAHEAVGDPHGQYVLAAGDTMTGALTISAAGVGLTVDNDAWIQNHAAIGNATTGPGAAIALDVIEAHVATAGTLLAMRMVASITPDGADFTGSLTAFQVSASTTNTAYNVAALRGTLLTTRHAGSGTLTEESVARVQLNNSGGGSVTTARMLWLDGASSANNGSIGTYTTLFFSPIPGIVTSQAPIVVAAHTNATNNSYVVLGQSAPPSGNWSIYSATANDGYFAGNILIGTATANSNMSRGLTINQAGFDDEAFALQSTDVAHGVTGLADTSTYLHLSKFSATAGGAFIGGFSESTVGIGITGYITTATTTPATSAVAAVVIDGALKSGTGVTALGANGLILAVRNNGTARFFLDGEGDSHQDVGTAWTNFDAYEDAGVLHGLAHALARPGNPIREGFAAALEYDRAFFERIGLASFNENGRHFVNMSRLTMLHTGAIRQLDGRLGRHEERLLVLEEENALLRERIKQLEAR